MVRVTVVSSGFKSWCSHYFWTYFGAGRGASEWHEELRGRGGDACVDWIWRARGGGSQIDVVAPSGCAGFGPAVLAGVTRRGGSPSSRLGAARPGSGRGIRLRRSFC